MLLYTVIARETTVLTEWSEKTGNFGTIMRSILPAMKKSKSYVVDNDTSTVDSPPQLEAEEPTLVSYMYDQRKCKGISFICLSDRSAGVKLPYRYLISVARKFADMCAAERIDPYKAMAGSINNAFIRDIHSTYLRMLVSPNGDISAGGNLDVKIIQNKIQGINDVLVESLETLASRNGHIEILVERTHELNDSTADFQRRTRKIASHEWWRARKLVISAVAVIVGLILLATTIELRLL